MKATKTSKKTLTRANAKKQRRARLTRPAKPVDMSDTREVQPKAKDAPAETTPTGFAFSPYAKGLLNRAIRNICENKGDKVEDPTARLEIRNRSELLDACGGDISVAVTCLGEVGGDEKQTASSVYSLCYAVMKATCFFANIDLRRFLDPRDEDASLEQRADLREDHREPPYGLGAEHPDPEFSDSTIIEALRDINLMLVTLAEAFGWEDRSGAGLPYVTAMDKDGKFTQFHDPVQALDYIETQRAVRRAKQRDARSAQMAIATKRAREQALKIAKAATA